MSQTNDPFSNVIPFELPGSIREIAEKGVQLDVLGASFGAKSLARRWCRGMSLRHFVLPAPVAVKMYLCDSNEELSLVNFGRGKQRRIDVTLN